MSVLPYKKLSEIRRKEIEAIMQRGNSILYRLFCTAHENGWTDSRLKFRCEVFRQMATGKRWFSICRARFNKSDIEAIQAVRDVELEIICGYTRMLSSLSMRFHNLYQHMDYDDLYNEGFIGMLNAIYSYGSGKKRSKSKKTKFITFAHHCIFRRILTKCQRSLPSHGLLIQYNQIVQDANARITFADVVEKMGLNPNEIIILQQMLTRVVSESDVQQKRSDWWGYRVHDDYSSMSLYWADVKGDKISVIGRRHNGMPLPPPGRDQLEPDMLEAIKATQLSEWESAVFQAYLIGRRGWQTEVAAAHINPETGQPYSKRAPHIALERVFGRIRETYEAKKAA